MPYHVVDCSLITSLMEERERIFSTIDSTLLTRAWQPIGDRFATKKS